MDVLCAPNSDQTVQSHCRMFKSLKVFVCVLHVILSIFTNSFCNNVSMRLLKMSVCRGSYTGSHPVLEYHDHEHSGRSQSHIQKEVLMSNVRDTV